MLTIGNERYLGEKEMASKYGLSTHWFQKARNTKKSPPYHKLNGRVYYKEDQVDDWFKMNLKPIED